MAIIILAFLFGMALALPANLAERRRNRRQQEALALNAVPAGVATTDATPDPYLMEFLTGEDGGQFAHQRMRIIARARESQSWKEAHAYVRQKFHGAERRRLAHDLVREEMACAAQIARDQRVQIRDPKFRQDLATLLQYTARSGRWDEARAYVRKTYAGARQPIVLRALAQAEATARALGASRKDENVEESEAHEDVASSEAL